eukprot:gene5418-5960_t
MSFFRIPSLRLSRSTDPNDVDNGNIPQASVNDEEDSFFALEESQADDTSTIYRAQRAEPIRRPPPKPSVPTRSNQTPSSPGGFPFPMLQPEYYPEGSSQVYEQPSYFASNPPYAANEEQEIQYSGVQYEPQYPGAQYESHYPSAQYEYYGNPTTDEYDPINAIMAEGYSYEEAYRVWHYRETVQHAPSTSFYSYSNPSTGYGTPQHQLYPAPLNQSYSSQHSTVCPSFSTPLPSPRVKDINEEQFELALLRSVEDEKRRRAKVSEDELARKEEIERANERAIQIALAKSFEEMVEDQKARSMANPHAIKELNDRALHEALTKSMYDMSGYSDRVIPGNMPVSNSRVLRKTYSDSANMTAASARSATRALQYRSLPNHSRGGLLPYSQLRFNSPAEGESRPGAYHSPNPSRLAYSRVVPAPNPDVASSKKPFSPP